MQQELAIAPFFLCFIALFVTGIFWFHSYTGLRREKAYLALVASVIAGGLRSFHHAKAVRQFMDSDELEMFLGVAAAGVLIVFLTAFALRLWGRWIGESATPAERQPGVPGIRAWFCTSNVFVGATLVVCAWLGEDISPLLGIVAVGGLLAAYPFLRMESPAAAPAPVPEDLSPEREKIVSMLEAGKLTPEESAELLQALGESARRPDHQIPLTNDQRLMLAGAALVTVGFFLPWFVMNPGKELSRLMSQRPALMQSSTQSSFGSPVQMPASPALPSVEVQTGVVSTSAGDIEHGLGWVTLALALAAAVLPYVATHLDAATMRTVRLLCLGVGALIVLYLLTRSLRFAGIGLIIAVGGYVVEIAGAMRERRTMPA